jgi:hypothetical protein
LANEYKVYLVHHAHVHGGEKVNEKLNLPESQAFFKTYLQYILFYLQRRPQNNTKTRVLFSCVWVFLGVAVRVRHSWKPKSQKRIVAPVLIKQLFIMYLSLQEFFSRKIQKIAKKSFFD